MYSFRNDYSEGAHQDILTALAETNLSQESSYGQDRFCLEAVKLIREALGNEKVDVHFLCGGTQVNMTAIAAFLRPHEGVISVESGHINIHEAGAIEATGHKIITVQGIDGKISPAAIEAAVTAHTDEHQVKPAMVYLSQSTEVGTIYSLLELEEIRAVCTKYSLLLYVDGARLGSALCAEGSDVTLFDLAMLADAFYIGGTKNGALLGEALVISNNSCKVDFRYHIKQRGALLSKGRVLGVQFKTLFSNNLYQELAIHANSMASLLRDGIEKLGYDFLNQSKTNQIFPIFPNSIISELSTDFEFYVWSATSDCHSSVRLVTSWATKQEEVFSFLSLLGSYTKSK